MCTDRPHGTMFEGLLESDSIKICSMAICREQKTTYPPTLIHEISPVVFVQFAKDDDRLSSS